MNTMEVYFNMAAGFTVVRGMYKEYVERIEWQGCEKVLEFGCGTGNLSRFIIRKINNGGHLTCLDISKLSIRILKWILRKHDNVQYCLGDIREIDIEDNEYDKVIIHYMLHDIPENERQSVTDKLSEKIKVGGKLYIREPINENHGMPPEEIQSLITNCGLKMIEDHYEKKAFAGHMYSVVFQK